VWFLLLAAVYPTPRYSYKQEGQCKGIAAFR
jgi:hypothetical protein